MKDNFQKIESFEKDVLKISFNSPIKIFRNINRNQWIENSKWPSDAYKTLSEIPLGNVLPAHIILWLRNIQVIFGNKRVNKRGYKNLWGYLLLFPFSKKNPLNIQANGIFFKRGGKYAVLFYTDKKEVIKVILSTKHLSSLKEEFKREVETLLFVNKIHHEKVKTPFIKSFNLKGPKYFFVQELIQNGKSLNYSTPSIMETVLKDVFDYMIEFYKKNKFMLLEPKIQNLNWKKTHLYLHHFKIEFILEKYRALINENKKMIYGKIHGDLHGDNILYTDTSIYILDWEKSIEDYWVEEICNRFLFIPKPIITSVYKKLINLFSFKEQAIYSVEEQQFIIICNRIFETIEQSKTIEDSKAYIRTQRNILLGNNLI